LSDPLFRTRVAAAESERFITDVRVIGHKKKEGSFVSDSNVLIL